MNDQQTKSLFDPPVNNKATAKQHDFVKSYEKNQPLSHSSDSMSSYRAGDRILKSGKIKGQMKTVLESVRRFPNCTSAEISKFADLDRYMIARRLSALEARGLVERGPERMCRVCKSPCVTWRAVQ